MDSPLPISDLPANVDAARAKAARLRLVDLHVHSPESGPDDYKGPTTDARGFLDAVRQSAPDLRVLGICDHFRCRLACETAGLSGPSELLVLPGMEIAVRLSEFSPDSVHMLVLFSETASTEDIYAFVPALNGPRYDAAGTGTTLSCRCSDLLQALANQQAICIAAHVHSDSGTRGWARKATLELVPLSRRRRQLRTLEQLSPAQKAELTRLNQELASIEERVQEAWLTFLGESDIAAVEVQSPEDVPHYRGQHVRDLGVRPVACILSSDAHRPEDIASPPKTTYLRLGGLSLSRVRAALADPETRIRFSLPQAQDRGRIEGVSLVRMPTDDPGFFRDVTIGFSENLTCIIGARGSGKSALIEAIRYTLDLPIAADDRSLRDDAERRRRATLAGTQVQLLLTPPRQSAITVTRVLDKEQQIHDAQDTARELEESLLKACPVEIYGWSEIEHLGRNPAAQRDLLDAGSSDTAAPAKAIQDAETALSTNRAQIVAKARAINDLMQELSDLPALQREIELLDTPELSQAFAERDSTETGKTLTDDLARDYKTAAEPLLSPNSSQDSPLLSRLGKWEDTLRQVQTTDAAIPDTLRAPSLGQQVSLLLNCAREIARGAQAIGYALSRAQESANRKLTEADEHVVEQLQVQFADDIARDKETVESLRQKANRRNDLRERLAGLTQAAQRLAEHQDHLARLSTDRDQTLVPDLEKALGERFRVRKTRATFITQRLKQFADRAPVTVDVDKGGDRTTFELRLYDADTDTGLLKGSSVNAFKERRVAAKMAAAFTPWQFARIIQSRQTEPLLSLLSEDGRGNPQQDAERLIRHLCSCREETEPHVPEKLDTILALQEVPTDDTPVIRLEDTPIESLSPGQRCTALLPIILTQGDWPLIIDQPEDNLDNRMIFHVVVDVLRRLKDKRQVIVATHNPNIPVSGDAEQVIVLHGESRAYGYPVADGSIDFPHVVRAVTDIMEGGEEAFKLRALKYGFDLRETITHHTRSDD